MKKIIAILCAALLAVLLAFMLTSGRDEELPGEQAPASGGRDESTLYRDEPHRGLATVHCALEINGARFRELGLGVPITVKCIVTNPLADRALDIGEFHGLAPALTQDAHGPATPGTTLVRPAMEAAPPGGVAVITWLLDGPLPPGRYDISLVTPPGIADNHGIDRVRVKPALLVINDQPATAGEIAWHELQLMAARGENEAVIARVRTELERDPEDLALRRELVDALERTGDFDGARDELLELGFRAQARQQAGNEEAPVHLPAWILTRDRLLLERAGRTAE